MELKEDNGLKSRRRPLRKDKEFCSTFIFTILYHMGNIDILKDYNEQKLYNEINNYFKRKNWFVSTFKSHAVNEVASKIYEIFIKNIYNLHNDKLDKNEVAIFIACNIWKILTKYSYETKAIEEDIGYSVSFTKESNPEELITLKLTDDFWTQYLKDIKSLYEEYINNYQNVECFDLNMLIYTFKDSKLLDINVDNIIKKYQNLTRNDVLRLCIYHLSDDLFVKYLNILNSCSNEKKKMIFEFIKPMHFYFQYAPKYWTIPEHYQKGELISDFFQKKLKLMDNYVIDNNEEIEKEVFSVNQEDEFVKMLYQHEMINEDAQNFFKEIYYMGYSVYVAEFKNTFLEQIDLLSAIIENHNFRALQNLLNAKKYLVDNPIVTEYAYIDYKIPKKDRNRFSKKSDVRPVSFDKTKILELKNYFLDFCDKLLTSDLEQTTFMKLSRNK